MMLRGRVVAAHGRQYVVELPDTTRLPCFPRGKKSEVACGDWVSLHKTSPDQGVIEAIEPRRSLLYRSNEFRQKLIAANADQIVIVAACEPVFFEDLITRALIAAETQDIASLIVLNKSDLTTLLPAARARLAALARLGYDILELSAQNDAASLRPALQGHTSVLVGQSGMGKSTLVNQLIPGAGAATREISTALDSGKHTTTHACLYHLDAESHLIDSPGLQEFGLAHLDRQTLEQSFREFRPWLGQCRFRNCRHDQEPDCALRDALAAGKIDAGRFASFLRLAGQASLS